MQLPLTIVQRTNVPCLKPTGNAVEVECVLYSTVSEVQILGFIRVAAHVADTPGSITLLTARSHLVGLTIDAYITD